ncbi:MAG: ABC-2 family transporter protein [Patescibacteria group bacterium]|nr:ABC-2 family transporter protein [Patescibacteria group bacterium]
MNLKRYFIYWLKSNELTLESLMADKLSSVLFITGKLLRFGFMLGFLFAIKEKIKLVSGYNVDQLVIFFLIYNLFDLAGQFFYRGIYWFRNEIISGDLDFKLVKPISPLFQVLTSHTDFLDIPQFIIVIIILIIKTPHVIWQDALVFCFLSFVSMIILTAVHIFIAAIGVITTEVDHTIWIFRNLSGMAQSPVDIYAEGVRAFLTFFIPIGLIFTFPAKALYGLLSPFAIFLAATMAVIFYYLSIKFWYYSLKTYASASS